MTKIVQFKQEDEIRCPYCELTDVYVNTFLDAESVDEVELREIISDLIFEVREVAHREGFIMGSDIGYEEGYKESIRSDIEIKQEILDRIESEDECDCCCEECCDCED